MIFFVWFSDSRGDPVWSFSGENKFSPIFSFGNKTTNGWNYFHTWSQPKILIIFTLAFPPGSGPLGATLRARLSCRYKNGRRNSRGTLRQKFILIAIWHSTNGPMDQWSNALWGSWKKLPKVVIAEIWFLHRFSSQVSKILTEAVQEPQEKKCKKPVAGVC